MRKAVIALAAITLASQPVMAQDKGPNAGAEVRGVVRPADPPNLGRVPSAHRPAVERTLNQLLAATLGSAVLSPPIGYDLKPLLFGYAPIKAISAKPPLAARVTGQIYWQTYQSGIDRVAPTPVAMSAFDVITNDITPIWKEKWGRDAQGQMYWEPERDGDRGGFPYHNSDLVVLTHIKRPLIIPVAKERVLRHELAEHRKELKQIHPSQTDLVAVSNGCIKEVEALLGSLSAAELAEPAYISLIAPPGTRPGRRCTMTVNENAQLARRIMVENPDFFDPSLPITAVQLIVVDYARLGKRTGRGWRLAASERIRNELDYAAIAKLLEAR